MCVRRWEDPSGNPIRSSSRVRVEDGNRLVIDIAKETDSGNYSCVINNIAATKRNNIMLVISGTSFINILNIPFITFIFLNIIELLNFYIIEFFESHLFYYLKGLPTYSVKHKLKCKLPLYPLSW